MQPRFLALIVLVALACSAGVAKADGDPIMPLSQVRAGMDCIGETVIQGTTITSFNVHVIDIVQQSGEGPRILVRVSGPAVDTTGVAEGFSGSPVYCTDSSGEVRNAGAISEGVGEYGNKVVLATPIEQMLGEPVTPPASARRVSYRTKALVGPLTVSGLAPWLTAVFSQAGKRAGRAVLSGSGSAEPTFPVQPLVPGASVAASYSQGDVVLGAVGTVTYRDGNNVYAFGHPLDGAGRRSLLLQDAYVYDVVNNPDTSDQTSYKLTAFGHTQGTLTSDAPNAVVGQLGAGPPLIPVDVTARDLDTGHTMALSSTVADETDVGQPTGTPTIDLVAPLSIAQAATAIYDGSPANQSGSMCFRLVLRESSVPLRFCNRYVGAGGAGDQGLAPPALASAAATDVVNALGLLDGVRFATLHVTSISASIEARRGLLEAAIGGARAPRAVRAGQTVIVRLTVRLFRGPLRTITFPLKIPRDASGKLTATVSGPSSDTSESASASTLVGAFADSLSGGSGGTPAPPSSVASLRRQFDAISHYDGLSVAFTGGGHRRRSGGAVYRDPNLLITGSATLRFSVR